PKISPDGRYVIFASDASNLVADDTNNQPDTFVYDRQTHTVQLLSQTALGDLGSGDSSFGEAVSGGGVFAAFGSSATNLIDANGDGIPDTDPNGPLSHIFFLHTAPPTPPLLLHNSPPAT